MNDRAPARLIRLPNDLTAAVITLDERGGFGARRVDNRPRLTVFADGRVGVINHSAIKVSAEDRQEFLRVMEDAGIKLSAEERQNLLRVDFDEHSDVGPVIEAKISERTRLHLLTFSVRLS